MMYWEPFMDEQQQRQRDKQVLAKAVATLADLREQERDGSLGQTGMFYLGFMNLRVLWLKCAYRMNYGKTAP